VGSIEEQKRIGGASIRVAAMIVCAMMLLTSAAMATDGALPESLIPMGDAVGIKFFSRGIVVAGVAGKDQKESAAPAETAGLKTGDIILSVDGKELEDSESLTYAIEESGGKPLSFRVMRDEKELTLSISPAQLQGDGLYRIGAWVRDSMAGIGTISYVDPTTGKFGALGHAICDVDSGVLMPVRIGEIVDAEIVGVQKGAAGAPGELKGDLNLNNPIGTLTDNTGSGIFGVLKDQTVIEGRQALPTAHSEEVKEGLVTIYTTVSGEEPASYEAEIIKINRKKNTERNMVIKITDPKLLDLTGGIVQGMSGSTIVQNGKIVGALTHVLVKDPTCGYGIFIENMLKAAG